MHLSYPHWLAQAVPSRSTAQTKLSDLRRVEAHYGDLDEHFDKDELQGIADELTYSADDARLGRPNPSRLEINGDLRSSLSSYKSAVTKYIRFRQEVEIESARGTLVEEGLASPDRAMEPGQTFSLERDLQAALRRDITQLEPGLTIIDGGAERSVASGRIDILAQDTEGRTVVIELKAVKATRDSLAQLMAYMGDLVDDENHSNIRGFLVAPDFDAKTISASRVVPTIALRAYSFSFKFTEIGTPALPS
ncbi:endonuclease NucS domain-containing protein [Pseudoroseicyclus sp. CXY001]|uniref:endonuclease NucS domain-containing protein n=1 Tax=Pseudoroseicyclus sp. CXY001 TaxID=3242492 RepID=UPI003570A57B